MKILAFDTALGGCSVAVLDTETSQFSSDIRSMTRGQSEVLVPMVQDIIEKSGIPFRDLDLIATTVGPGAFTGLRIGLSAARSFGLALNVPVDGVLTTECVAASFFSQNKRIENDLLVVIETKRDDFYAQVFSKDNKPLDTVSALSVELVLANYQSRVLNVCGDGTMRLRTVLDANWPENWILAEGFDLIDTVILAGIAAHRRLAGTERPADPVYLRDADVSVSTRPARTIAAKK